MIEVINLSKSFKDKVVLDDLSYNFDNGQVYSIIAPNGTGKTTLISILSGLLIQDSGYVKFSGVNTQKETFILLAGEKTFTLKTRLKKMLFILVASTKKVLMK